jgi:hypothetical protein
MTSSKPRLSFCATLRRSTWLIATFWLVGCSMPGGAAFENSLNRSSRVLMVGDSLTVGPFGDHMQNWLQTNLGPQRVFIYGSCGSSPEHWLTATEPFISPCGYRETTPQTKRLEKHHNGIKPARVATPKIEQLIATHRPQIVIIQLGTNHFDTLAKEGREAIPKLEAIYDEFSRALRRPGSKVRMVIWITPPDSTKFPDWVEQEVNRIIAANNSKHGYGTFFSQTRYIPGETGSDGVHYNEKGAEIWSTPIIQKINKAFTRYRIK